MPFPAFGDFTTDTAATGAGGDIVTLAAPTGVASDDYQVVAISYATGTVTFSTPTGWTKLVDQPVNSPTSGASGTSRIVVYESATETGEFSCTTGAIRVLGAARAYWTLPEGSTGRTVTPAVTIEAEGTASTSHTMPSITTTVGDSLVIGIGCSDQTNPPGASQSWTGFGSFTERVDFTGGNASEIQAVGIADLQVASPGTVSGHVFTTATADECGLVTIVLNGFSDEEPPADTAAKTRAFFSLL